MRKEIFFLKICFCSVVLGMILSASTVTLVYGFEPIAGSKIEVEGVVVNGTPGADRPVGISVALHTNKLDEGVSLVQTFTGSDGSFRFTDVEVINEALYGISVIYKGATYTVGIDLAFVSDPLEIVVYDPTSSDEVISISRASLLFTNADIAARRVSVMEMVTLRNGSDLTYTPGDGPMELLRFGLPVGSDQLVVDTGLEQADWVQVDRGFALLASVPPGDHEIMYSYRVPYSKDSLSFTKKWRYGAQDLRIVVPAGLFDVTTDLGMPIQVMDIGGINYDVQEAINIGRGQVTEVRLTGFPRPTFIQTFSHNLNSVRYEYIGPVGLALILFAGAALGTWRTLRYRRRTASWFPGSDERQVIEDLITELNVRHEDGSITRQEHRRRLDTLSRRLGVLPEE